MGPAFRMNPFALSLVLVPGAVALLLFLVFTYLYQQSRREYFRAWQIGWAAYTLHSVFEAWDTFYGPSPAAFLAGSLLLVLMALCIVASTRLVRESFRLHWYDILLPLIGLGLVLADLHDRTGIRNATLALPANRVGAGLALAFAYAAVVFFRRATLKGSLAFRLLSASLGFWALLLIASRLQAPFVSLFDQAGHILGPLPQMLLGIAMILVLIENERNIVRENALAFSTLGVDSDRLLSASELLPAMGAILGRLAAPLPSSRALIYTADAWRSVLPAVQRGFSSHVLPRLTASGAGEYISELAYRNGGCFAIRNLAEAPEPVPVSPGGRFQSLKDILQGEHVGEFTAINLQTRDHNFGVLLFPRAGHYLFGTSNLRFLTGLAFQVGATLENYTTMHQAQRRSREYELLAQIGQTISSHLNQEQMLLSIHHELGQLFDTSYFYIAFQDGNEICFELEIENGQRLLKRRRALANGLTEYVLRTGEPLLVRSDTDGACERLGVKFIPARQAKSFLAVPIPLVGQPGGVMAAMSADREYAFEQRDVEVLQTVAGQVSVALENARLFAEEQRRSLQLAFLNNISRTAISSEDATQMMALIVAEIQRNFRFDHIGIGILDYATQHIEIKAEAGVSAQAMGKRFPLGSGIPGRTARSGETSLLQQVPAGAADGVLPDARSAFCLPITYGETLVGVLNIESRQENAFSPNDVLVLKTLADLLATALHNAFVFQKMQQQAITDSLTGVKTRRFFLEAMNSEWKRAARSGRPFSAVLMDLDKFKDVNDTRGHLEGDLVLARVGRLLEQKCRQSNVVARYGGDEFVILMPETSVEQAQSLAERLRIWLEGDPMLEQMKVTGSFGVASFPAHGLKAEEILDAADTAMYMAKHAGGNRVIAAEGESEQVSIELNH